MNVLRCTLCKRIVPDGFNCCPFCNVGFVAVLECTICGTSLSPGTTNCPRCTRLNAELQSASLVPQASPPVTCLPAQVQLPQYAVAVRRVAETYSSGRYGVSADVQIPSGDVAVMNLMGQAATLLRMLAEKMNDFQAHMDLTRENIRACRRLADDLQEEVERRTGPRG